MDNVCAHYLSLVTFNTGLISSLGFVGGRGYVIYGSFYVFKRKRVIRRGNVIHDKLFCLCLYNWGFTVFITGQQELVLLYILLNI